METLPAGVDVEIRAVSAIVGKARDDAIFTEDGTAVPVTVIEASPNKVTAIRRPCRDGYDAVQLAGDPSPPRTSSPRPSSAT